MGGKRMGLIRGRTLLIFCMSVFGSISFASAAVGQLFINTKSVSTKIDTNGTIYTYYKTPEITIIQPKQFSFIFQTNGTSTRNLVYNGQCKTALNGTYFGTNPDKTYFPAGIRYSFGSLLSPIYQPAKDPNLKVLLGSNGETIAFMDNDTFDFIKEFSTMPQRSWYLNTGPWLVRDGKINHEVVDFTSHWQRKATRSAILTSADGKVSFVVATQPISLPQFVTFAYAAGLGTGTFQFVNIDGGSSTSLQTPHKTYNAKKILPAFICIQ